MPIFFTDSASFNDVRISGSMLVSGTVSFTANSGGLTGSLFGTSSRAVTASFVLPAGLPANTVSSSTQVNYTQLQNIPAGIISGSTFSSPSQGTVRALINGVQTDVDTGLQTGDSPQFTNLNVSTTFTASIISASTTLTASRVQLNGLTDITVANKVLVLNTATNQIFTTSSVGVGGGGTSAAFPYDGRTIPAVISGSLIISGSGTVPTLRVTGSTTLLGSGSRIFVISGSQGPLLEIGDTAATTDLFTLTSASVDVFRVTNSQQTIVSGTLTVSSTQNSPVTISGSINDFFELEVVNFNAGNNASADFVVSSNNTTDFGNFAAFGINSTTFNGPLVGGASDGYLYLTSSVGELDIGHATPGANSNIRLFTGGPNSTANTRVFISASGNVGIGTTTNLRNTLTVNGSVSASSVTGSLTGSFTGAITHFSPSTVKLTVGTTAPSSPAINDLWVDTN